MRARSRHLLLVGLVAGLLFGACSDGSEGGNKPIDPPSQAEGLITEIRPEEGGPQSFVLETETDGTLEVIIADDVDYGFDLHHLHEHMDGDLPVRVELEERDGQAVALSIEDV